MVLCFHHFKIGIILTEDKYENVNPLSLQNGYTALHWGVNKNNKECVAVLLEKGANPLIKDKV